MTHSFSWSGRAYSKVLFFCFEAGVGGSGNLSGHFTGSSSKD